MIEKIELALLALLVLSCWLGCLGMLRVREPTQALHYLSLPAGFGAALLPIAVWCATGWSITTLKAALIALFLMAANSVVTHATARAFRVRKLGHWQPRTEDHVEFLTRGRTK